MLKLVGNEIWRSEEKVGWVEGNHVYAHDGRKLGYFQDSHIFNEAGEKVAYIEGDFLYSEDGKVKVDLEKIAEEIEGGIMPLLGKCAVYILLGD